MEFAALGGVRTGLFAVGSVGKRFGVAPLAPYAGGLLAAGVLALCILCCARGCPCCKGEEFSPGNLVEAALGGCMLLSMGTLAQRDQIDITGTHVDVKITSTDSPIMRFKDIAVTITMPRSFSKVERIKLERAAEACPIKHSFDADIAIAMSYVYPEGE